MRAIFLGDEVSAAGFRLAGIRTLSPKPGQVEKELQRAAQQVSLILITAEAAKEVSDGLISDLLLSPEPMLLILPDLREHEQPRDPIAPIRKHLGIRQDLIAEE